MKNRIETHPIRARYRQATGQEPTFKGLYSEILSAEYASWVDKFVLISELHEYGL